jgi:hypothetical protein
MAWTPAFAGVTLLLLLALLTACGRLPQPFAGNPGVTARRLSQPPPARLVVEVPNGAQLPEPSARAFASAMAEALLDRELPAVVGNAAGRRRPEWRLQMSAELRDGRVLPLYTLQNPEGKTQGNTQGQPMDPASWARGAPETFRQAAADAAPAIAAMLADIRAAQEGSDPNSLVNRPARLFVPDVTGAPGDGNQSLARQMRRQLPQLGELVAETQDAADFIVAGQVRTSPGESGGTNVEIEWVVRDARGAECGRVSQLHEVPPHLLDGLWADVALVAAQEAASGVRAVITRWTGSRAPAAAEPGGNKATP